jgi:ribosomal protein S18 acetylase RimI-like enzyme
LPLSVTPLHGADYPRWLELARGYKAFYKTQVTDAEYARAWQRLLDNDRVWGLGAHLDGELVGITHFLFHTGTWNHEVCYLQDLFVDPTVRGRGVARALIDAVAKAARERGAEKLYWLTQDHNTAARALYDKVGKYNHFIRYDYPL